MTRKEALNIMELGYKVVSGKGEDRDTGYINDVDHDMAKIAWDSGIVTWQPLDLLELL